MTEEEGHQQELEAREQIEASRNVHQRLAAAMAEVPYVQKESVKGLGYKIVSHDSVTEAVRPALLRNGVIAYPVEPLEYTQAGNMTQLKMTMRFANIDNPTDHIDIPSFGYGISNQDRGPGMAMSYAVKYAYLKMMGLSSGEDSDKGNEAKIEAPQLAPDGTEVPSFEEAVLTCAASIKAIKDGISACTDEGLAVASESWQELSGGEKMALWVAPSKGGCFTSEERAIIKSKEFREAHFGA